jgi:hypothetical protein
MIMNLFFDALSEAVNGRTQICYTKDFTLRTACVHCQAEDIILSPKHFEIDHIFRFKGMSNPDDLSIVCAIASRDGSIKGTMVDACGVYSDSLKEKMNSKLKAIK